jgi:hypothetical protein
MDFLCKRYGGSPFFILDRYVSEHRLNEFIYETWKLHNEEEIFDIWLHKVEGKSYQEFRDSLEPPKPVDKREVASTIEDSMRILTGFTLEEG